MALNTSPLPRVARKCVRYGHGMTTRCPSNFPIARLKCFTTTLLCLTCTFIVSRDFETGATPAHGYRRNTATVSGGGEPKGVRATSHVSPSYRPHSECAPPRKAWDKKVQGENGAEIGGEEEETMDPCLHAAPCGLINRRMSNKRGRATPGSVVIKIPDFTVLRGTYDKLRRTTPHGHEFWVGVFDRRVRGPPRSHLSTAEFTAIAEGLLPGGSNRPVSSVSSPSDHHQLQRGVNLL